MRYSLFRRSFITKTEEFDDILKNTPRDTRVMRRPGQKSMNDMALNRQFAVIIGEPWSDLQAEREEQACMDAEDQAMRAIVASEAKRRSQAMAALEKNQAQEKKAQEKEERARLKKQEKEAAKKVSGATTKQARVQPVKTCCMPTCLKTEAQGATLTKCVAKCCKLLFCADCDAARRQHTANIHC